MGPPSEGDPPGWLVLRELDALNRRMDTTDARVNARINHLDEHGTRGIDALRAQLAVLQRDITDHEAMHAEQARAQVTSRRWLMTVIVALVTPLYPLLWAGVFR